MKQIFRSYSGDTDRKVFNIYVQSRESELATQSKVRKHKYSCSRKHIKKLYGRCITKERKKTNEHFFFRGNFSETPSNSHLVGNGNVSAK